MSRRMTAAESRALWSRVSQEQIDEMTRIAVRFFTGKDPEAQITDPEAENDRANDRPAAPLTPEPEQ